MFSIADDPCAATRLRPVNVTVRVPELASKFPVTEFVAKICESITVIKTKPNIKRIVKRRTTG
jgi:hypothetical protein